MLIVCGCCLAVTDSLSALRGDAVITVVLLRWCVTADVTRSIGPVDSRHHSDCLLHFYYSYHSLAAAVAARRPTLLLKPGAEITPEANEPSHTHTQSEREWLLLAVFVLPINTRKHSFRLSVCVFGEVRGREGRWGRGLNQNMCGWIQCCIVFNPYLII